MRSEVNMDGSADLIRALAREALEQCRDGDRRNVSWLRVYFGMAGESDTPERNGTSWEQIAEWEACAVDHPERG